MSVKCLFNSSGFYTYFDVNQALVAWCVTVFLYSLCLLLSAPVERNSLQVGGGVRISFYTYFSLLFFSSLFLLVLHICSYGSDQD